MSRIENQMNSQEDYERINREVADLKKKLNKKQNRHLLSCSNILILFILLILAAICYVVYAVAETGIVYVPYVSLFAYSDPAPIHQVVTTDATISIIDILNQQIVSQGIYAESLPAKISLSFTENQLSGYLKSLLIKDENSKFDLAQLAVDNESFEVFAHYNDPPFYLTVKINPQIDSSGQLDFQVKKVKVGQLSLPDFVGSIVIQSILLKPLNLFKSLLFKDITLTSIELAPPKIFINALLNKLPDAQ